jgi:hypothetical protein
MSQPGGWKLGWMMAEWMLEGTQLERWTLEALQKMKK